MLTTRAHWLLTVSGAGLVASLVLRQEGVALASLALMFWLATEWLAFRWRALRGEHLFLLMSRTIDGSSRPTQVVTIDGRHRVQLTATPSPRLAGLRFWIEDALPPGCHVDTGSPRHVADVGGDRPLSWEYVLQPLRNGRLALPGLQVRLSDPQGLFELHRFVPLRQELTVLPVLIRQQTTESVLKQKNCQLFTGQHRHRQAGVSGELLSIRDYQTGDPPRTIAWKASARLGKLMTCEYESEVPIRATIISDLSSYQFAGRPGPSRADKIVSVTASIARLLLSDRDPVACALVNESHHARIPHSHGQRQLTRILHVLLARLNSFESPAGIPYDELLAVTWTACMQRFPELFDERVNPQLGLLRMGWRRHEQLRLRQLTLALAELERRPLGYARRLFEDAAELSAACLRFLLRFPTSIAPAPVLQRAELRQARQRAMNSVCQALMEGVARARDNELFVIAGVPPVDQGDLDRLENALRVARAAYHRVIMLSVSQQPSGMSLGDPTAQRIIAAAEYQETLATNHQLRQRLTRLGVAVAEVDGPTLTEELASQVELLRFGRARRLGRRRSRTRGRSGRLDGQLDGGNAMTMDHDQSAMPARPFDVRDGFGSGDDPPADSRGGPPADSLADAFADRKSSALLLAVLAGFLLLVYMPLAALPPYGLVLLPIMTAGLLLKRQFYVLVLILFVGLFSQLAGAFEWGALNDILARDVAAALALLTLILLLLRYLELDVLKFTWHSRLFDPPAATLAQQRGNTRAGLRPLTWSLWRVPLAVLLAGVLLRLVPESQFLPNRYKFDPSVIRTILIGWIMLAAVMIPGSLLSLLRWRRLTRSQAAIYIRGQFDDDLGELRGVERARARALIRRRPKT